MKTIQVDNDVVFLNYKFDDECSDEMHENQCKQLFDVLDELYEGLSFENVHLVTGITLNINCIDKSYDFSYTFVDGMPEQEKIKLQQRLDDLMKSNIVF